MIQEQEEVTTQQQTFDLDSAAEYLGYKRNSVRNLASPQRNYVLPDRRLENNGDWLFYKDELDAHKNGTPMPIHSHESESEIKEQQYTIRSAAEYCGVPTRTIYDWLDAGKLTKQHSNGYLLFPQSELDACKSERERGYVEPVMETPEPVGAPQPVQEPEPDVVSEPTGTPMTPTQHDLVGWMGVLATLEHNGIVPLSIKDVTPPVRREWLVEMMTPEDGVQAVRVVLDRNGYRMEQVSKK